MNHNRAADGGRDEPEAAPPAHEPRRGGIAARAHPGASRGEPAYLAGLNPEQREAVETTEGPVLVLAGAGTGKTRVLTTRIAHLLATSRALPSQILAVTFTNKAAREMKERVGYLVGPAAEGMPWLGTFHSIGTKILRRHAELVGLKSGFTILDTDDQIRLLKQVIQAENVDEKRWPARQLASFIDGWKNRALGPEQVPPGEAAAFANGRGGELYRLYQERLKTLNAADFGDLLLECIRLFRENADVLEQYQHRFRYMLVDEYQDTNVAQYLWLRLLAQGRDPEHRNLCCVGDDDQCLAAGTLVTTGDGVPQPIEVIEPGATVMSCYGSGVFRPAKVLRVHRRRREGPLVTIRLESGQELTSTPEHTHFAGYRLGTTRQLHFVYLMHKAGVGYRLGTSQIYTRGQVKPMVGFLQRALQEGADALWIVSTHASENESRFEEIRLSLAFGIPTLPFKARKGASQNGLVHDQALIEKLYACVDSDTGAERLMEAVGLSPKAPHHRPRSRNSSRRNVMLTLCGDRRGASPMHRISIVGNDAEGADALRKLGFSVRPAKAGSQSWRVETADASWSRIAAQVERMREAFDLNIIRQARFGADNAGTAARASASLPFIRACDVRPGMMMFTADGYGIVESVRMVRGETDIVDLDVERTHNYIAEGVVTHNSIYGWRGAEVDNILRFEHDFPGARVIRLERNYRSTAHILDAASHLIARNEGRLGKTLRTEDVPGEKVTVTGAWDSEEEARLVGEEIEALQAKGHALSEIAVLVRISAQMRELEDRFVQLGLPYRVIGGPRFYERMEIRDALAYFRAVAQPADDLAFERIVNTPKRGLGDATVQTLHGHARAARIPLLEAARYLVETEELKPKARGALRDLVLSFARWSAQLPHVSHVELAQTVLDESGYTEMWQKDRSAEAAGRLDNLKELVRSLEEFPDLPAFLEHVSLVMDAVEGEGGDRVSLMTLHAAKGLEFDTIFLPGWEEGLFPSQRALDENGRAGLEEERRLAHVGLTRARRRAKIYFAANRRIHGLWNATIPSRFIDELPEAAVEVTEAPANFTYGSYGGSRFDRMEEPFRSSYRTPGWQRAQSRGFGSGTGSNPGFGESGPARGARKGPMLIEGELVAKSTGTVSAFAAGDRVFHQKFGPGSVAAVDGNKLTVDFDKAGRKMVLDSFVGRE